MSHTRRRLVALGDSLTEGFCNGGRSMLPYTQRLGELAGARLAITNHGVSGETARAMLRRLDLALDGAPDWVVLLAGTNDIGMGSTADEVVASLTAMYDRVLAAEQSVRLLAVSVPRSDFDSFQGIGARKRAVNEAIAAYVAAHAPRARLLDLYTAMPIYTNADAVHRKRYWDRDGLHMTAEGYAHFGELVWDAIKADVTV